MKSKTRCSYRNSNYDSDIPLGNIIFLMECNLIENLKPMYLLMKRVKQVRSCFKLVSLDNFRFVFFYLFQLQENVEM